MASIINSTIIFSSGRQVKLMGNSIGISTALELGDSYMGRILYFDTEHEQYPEISPVANPYNLSKEDVLEVIELLISLAKKARSNIIQFGIDNPLIFYLGS